MLASLNYSINRNVLLELIPSEQELLSRIRKLDEKEWQSHSITKNLLYLRFLHNHITAAFDNIQHRLDFDAHSISSSLVLLVDMEQVDVQTFFLKNMLKLTSHIGNCDSQTAAKLLKLGHILCERLPASHSQLFEQDLVNWKSYLELLSHLYQISPAAFTDWNSKLSAILEISDKSAEAWLHNMLVQSVSLTFIMTLNDFFESHFSFKISLEKLFTSMISDILKQDVSRKVIQDLCDSLGEVSDSCFASRALVFKEILYKNVREWSFVPLKESDYAEFVERSTLLSQVFGFQSDKEWQRFAEQLALIEWHWSDVDLQHLSIESPSLPDADKVELIRTSKSNNQFLIVYLLVMDNPVLLAAFLKHLNEIGEIPEEFLAFLALHHATFICEVSLFDCD